MVMVEPKEVIQTNLIQSPHFPANPTTIRFLKERQIGTWRVYAVMFMDDTGQEWHCTFGLTRDESGAWVIRGGGGGVGTNTGVSIGAKPRAKLAATWNARGFCAGGFVFAGNHPISHVRLVCPKNVRLEDTVDASLVLFATDVSFEMDEPITVELYDSTGALVRSHKLF